MVVRTKRTMWAKIDSPFVFLTLRRTWNKNPTVSGGRLIWVENPLPDTKNTAVECNPNPLCIFLSGDTYEWSHARKVTLPPSPPPSAWPENRPSLIPSVNPALEQLNDSFRPPNCSEIIRGSNAPFAQITSNSTDHEETKREKKKNRIVFKRGVQCKAIDRAVACPQPCLVCILHRIEHEITKQTPPSQ